jgi:hypothetical protein
MKNFVFGFSILCSALVCTFLFSKISLNGYKTDFYFFLATLFLNAFSFFLLRKDLRAKWKSYINLSIAMFLTIGLFIFLWADTLQVDKVYEPTNNQYNVYSSLTGWYKRAYFKKHQAGLCNDGVLWQTKVPYYFPLIEIETSKDECHKVGNDSTYLWLFKHVPE